MVTAPLCHGSTNSLENASVNGCACVPIKLYKKQCYTRLGPRTTACYHLIHSFLTLNSLFYCLSLFSIFLPSFGKRLMFLVSVCMWLCIYICAFLVPEKGEVRKEGRETPCVSRLERTPGFPREWLRQQWERLRNNFLRKG